MQYKEELDLLRQQIPIGIRHGGNLLIKTNGNINEARRLFEDELIEIIVSKTAVSQEDAHKHLITADYDIAKTLISIDESRFTLPERILRKSKDNKEDALTLLARNLEDAKRIKRGYWLTLDQLQDLSAVQYCLLVVKEWLDYEDYEGFDTAMYFYLDIVAAQIETELLLPEVADCLRIARKRSDEIVAQYKFAEKPSLLGNMLNEDKSFMRSESAFKKARPVIIDRLYELVVNNIGKFV
ncbi:hypothetical protein [Chitinophaga sp. RAB17]|uniref:hypothetical protein n=1 Tax=Chitinophaga sp. RAB17 TaxID=3233049 RepID=UPI003F8E3502